MKIELTTDQIKQLIDDGFLDIDLGYGSKLYYECAADGTFNYGEIFDPCGLTEKRKSFAFDRKDLNKLKPTKPDDPSWYHNDPLCPTCQTYMIYKFAIFFSVIFIIFILNLVRKNKLDEKYSILEENLVKLLKKAEESNE